ncbi:TAF13 factor, partial [Polypterus senegalus]
MERQWKSGDLVVGIPNVSDLAVVGNQVLRDWDECHTEARDREVSSLVRVFQEGSCRECLACCDAQTGLAVRCMMYGFGDDQNPYTESVDILEDLVIEFITEMTHKAMSIGRQGRVQVEDIVFLIRKDPRKFARVKDLLTMNEELKRARKAFDEANYGS